MDAAQHLAAMVAAATAAAAVGGVAVVVSVVGGPRRRRARPLDMAGGRVRLAARTMERLAIIVAVLALAPVCLTSSTDPLLLVAVCCTLGAAVMAARRGSFDSMVPADVEDVVEDDGYVDAEPRRSINHG
jgi:hypothetical protein